MKNIFKLKSINQYLSDIYVSKLEAFILIFLACLYAVAEFGGIGMLGPIIQYLSEGPEVYQRDNLPMIWKALISLSLFLRIKINLLFLLILAFIPIIMRQLFFYLQKSYAANIQSRTVARLREECFKKILRADLDFFLKHGQGNVVSVLTLEAMRAGKTIYQILSLSSSIALLSLYTALLLIIEPKLTFVSIIAFSASFFLAMPIIRYSRKYSEEISHQNTDLISQAGDKIYGIRLVKLYSHEEKDSKNIGIIIKKLSDTLAKAGIAEAKIISLTEPVVIFGVFVILYIAVDLYSMSLANLGVFLFVLYRILPHVKDINSKWQAVNLHFQSFKYVKKIVQSAIDSRRIKSGSILFKGLKHEIIFDNVCFSYNGNSSDNFVIKNLSFRIPQGSFTAIVGPSGAGKSTLVDLIPRLREVTRGEIRIDGTPIKAFELKSLRSRIGFLSQEPCLFNNTVLKNITYGFQGNAALKEVIAAAKKAYSHQFIECLPKKYDQNLGDRGTRLSGGERQRLALARLIFHDPDIIILDEYTSALDSESERYIQVALSHIRKNKTMIVIAHRLSTIKKADQILVLEDGEIIECGDFKTLINNNSAFSRLFEAQMFF